jgi:preprotein translocase subunit SecA
MFQNMIEGIKEDVLYYLFRVSYSREEEQEAIEQQEQEVYYNRGDEAAQPKKPIRADDSKVGRNDPCPCGSGKKYKKCCGR